MRRVNSATVARRSHFLSVLALTITLTGPRLLAADDHNPIGVTGAFEGIITTGGAYNVLNHNATRQIDDIVVPGAIGKYGLKMTRYYNSRSERGATFMGAGWTHTYQWSTSTWDNKFYYPNGNVLDSSSEDPLGISDDC